MESNVKRDKVDGFAPNEYIIYSIAASSTFVKFIRSK